jgi:hypothetical protein
VNRRLAVAFVVAATAGCHQARQPPIPAWPELTWYHWLGDRAQAAPAPVDTVRSRFELSSPGYVVFADDPNSWTEWLRFLPLAAPGTPVRDAGGNVVVPGNDDHLAGVIAIDASNHQPGVDAVLRLNAEWRWNVNDLRTLYLSDGGFELPLQRWMAGDRLAIVDGRASWVRQAELAGRLDHATFRAFLESVFLVSSSQALLAESVALAPAALAPGAFFLHPGPRAEALVVLDVATTPSGERVMLLARARSPAESIHVVRPDRASPWFRARPDEQIQVADGPIFSWNELRAMKRLRSRGEGACVGLLCPAGP